MTEEDDPFDTATAPEAQVPDDCEINISLPQKMLRDALFESLRMDYDRKLAKICSSALDLVKKDLHEYVAQMVHEIAEDSEFKSSLRSAMKRRMHEVLVARTAHHIKRAPPDQVQLMIDVITSEGGKQK